jgi:hypothetical protein
MAAMTTPPPARARPGTMGNRTVVLAADGLAVIAGPCQCNHSGGHWSAGALAACGARRAAAINQGSDT